MKLAIVGATGDVGSAVAEQAAARGWQVVAVSRSSDRLDRLHVRVPSDQLTTIVGSIAGDASGHDLAGALAPHAPTAVVTAVNGSKFLRPTLEWGAEDFVDVLRSDLVPHLVAANALLPLVPDGGTYLAVGGGMADLTVRGTMHNSAVQAALRMMMRSFAAATKDTQAHVRELLIAAMVNVEAADKTAGRSWLLASDIARTICDVVERPGNYPGPILRLDADGLTQSP